ncbi:DUF1972 domain-containing protein [Leifsonia sp. Root112D2]|uniref:DUF1972 domain-containing protein n=1 Tax=Leifsonia sp. Root112D2 TaxID=1736426 RepID=UPI0009EA7725|nr:DUF1972 domain-containing protein [Leifsonia sp. Root112D2]
MRIAMIGTRGVPAAYGGFETAVEEIGKRLAERGHDITVYCRGAKGPRQAEYLGMRLVHLPALHGKSIETLSHTALSAAHAGLAGRFDAAFVFNAANAPFLPLLRMRGIPVAVHVDGLEWKRGKWGKLGRSYYRWAERFSVQWSDALIADAQGIADYYSHEFSAETQLLTYGAPLLVAQPSDRLSELGLSADDYHLVVARFEPENHVDVIVDGYRKSSAKKPLIVVGGAPYAARYTEGIAASAANDDRIRLVGSIYDQELLDQLYAHACTYLHGHSVGGTNPSLLRAMGAATPVIAFDVIFNREVLGPDGQYFANVDAVARYVNEAESAPQMTSQNGNRLQARARARYDWEDVATGYESLASRLSAGAVPRLRPHARRSRVPWDPSARDTKLIGDIGATPGVEEAVNRGAP